MTEDEIEPAVTALLQDMWERRHPGHPMPTCGDPLCTWTEHGGFPDARDELRKRDEQD
jgi:hypothetical protein